MLAILRIIVVKGSMVVVLVGLITRADILLLEPQTLEAAEVVKADMLKLQEPEAQALLSLDTGFSKRII